MKPKTLASVAVLAVFPTVLAAQDWSGAYGGFTTGYAFGDAIHTYDNGAPTDNASPSGALIGGFVGYGIQSGSFVYGAEADVDLNNASGSFSNLTGATSEGTTSGVWQASLRGVAGVAGQLSGKPALYYVTAGWAVGEFDFLGGPAPGGGTNPYSDTVNGWTVGLGIDVKLQPNTALRVEYRYTDFQEASGVLAPAFPGVTMPVDIDQHAIRVGLRMQF